MFFSQLSIVVFTAILIKRHDVLHDSAVFHASKFKQLISEDAIIWELYY